LTVANTAGAALVFFVVFFGFGFVTMVPDPEPAAIDGAANDATRPTAAMPAISALIFMTWFPVKQTFADRSTSPVVRITYKSHLRIPGAFGA
jgi:hypothetical protein